MGREGRTQRSEDRYPGRDAGRGFVRRGRLTAEECRQSAEDGSYESEEKFSYTQDRQPACVMQCVFPVITRNLLFHPLADIVVAAQRGRWLCYPGIDACDVALQVRGGSLNRRCSLPQD